MSDSPRPSPKYKPVSLFVTCIVDMIYPHTGISVVEILDHLGIEVKFPMSQTCCGQVGFNSGFWNDAREVALTGVDSIALGAITHSAPAIDIGLDVLVPADLQ